MSAEATVGVYFASVCIVAFATMFACFAWQDDQRRLAAAAATLAALFGVPMLVRLWFALVLG